METPDYLAPLGLPFLRRLLRKKVSMAETVWSTAGIEIHGNQENNAPCPFHGESSKSNSFSLSISGDGRFHCHSVGCGIKGSDVIDWWAAFHGLETMDAAHQLYSLFVERTLSQSLVDQYHRNLLLNNGPLAYLKTERGLTDQTIRAFKLGFDNERITIPIQNEHGLVVNIRRYDWTKQHAVKMLPYAEGFGSARLFPIGAFLGDDILLCEGEWDAIISRQMGFNAVTHTGGVETWKSEWSLLFKGKKAIICFDVNDKGDAGTIRGAEIAQTLSRVASNVRQIILPLKEEGGDLTDYFVKHSQPAAALQKLIDETIPIVSSPTTTEAVEDVLDVSLEQAANAENENRVLRVQVVVAGKDLAPFWIVHKINIACTAECPSAVGHCRLREAGFNTDIEISPLELHTLPLLNASDTQVKGYLKSLLALPRVCKVKVTTLESQTVEHVQLIPMLDYAATEVTPYTIRDGYFLGHGLRTNQGYEIICRTVAEPRNQYAAHVILKAAPSSSLAERFVLTDEVRERLEVFRTDNIEERLNQIYTYLAHNATRIFQREDLHRVVDLAFHSVLSFRFDQEFVRKGWLDVGVVGDTRTGKGFVAEGLVRHYGVGEVVSAENCSFAGLVGGMQQTNQRWFITWGRLVLNDRRLIVVDESGELSQSDMARLSRIRSEGVAEITKIQSARTTARTRIVWLGSPRSGESIAEYSHGIDAVMEMFGKLDDVARLDIATVLASGEVSAAIINRPHVPKLKSEFTATACKQLILWCWSRKPSEVFFTKGAIKAVYHYATEFGKLYSPKIPLVQVESFRFKLARVAVAIAGRVFSASTDGKILVVDEQAVAAAVQTFQLCYEKDAMGYGEMSRLAFERDTLRDLPALAKLIRDLGPRRVDFAQGVLEQNKLTLHDLCDFTAMPRDDVRVLVSNLVRQRALQKKDTYYIKRPSFSRLLRKIVEEGSSDANA